MSFWLYILKCADESYYVGHTDNLERRISQHEQGLIVGYTSTRRPVQLVHTQVFPTREEALAAERQIKGWSRKKKEAMIRGDWTAVSALARSRNSPSSCPSTKPVLSLSKNSGRTDQES